MGNIFAVILAAVVAGCFVQIMFLTSKVKEYVKANKGIITLNVLQEFMKIMGQDINTSQKVSKLNQVLIDGYSLEYSSIVMFDGTSYGVKTSNVDPSLWEYLNQLHTEQEFIESISTASIKYLKTDNDNTVLSYPSAERKGNKISYVFPIIYR